MSTRIGEKLTWDKSSHLPVTLLLLPLLHYISGTAYFWRSSSSYGGKRVHNFRWKSMSKLLYVPKSLLFLWNDLPMTLPIPWPQICKRSWRTTLTTFTISLEVHIFTPGVNNTAKLEFGLEFEPSRGTVPKN